MPRGPTRALWRKQNLLIFPRQSNVSGGITGSSVPTQLSLAYAKGTNRRNKRYFTRQRHVTPQHRQPAARLDRDQHAAFFEGQDPTQLVMTQERRSKVQTLLIILSQWYHTPTWHAKRRSAVCSLQLWNGMVAQKGGKSMVDPLHLSSPVAAWKSMWYVGKGFCS